MARERVPYSDLSTPELDSFLTAMKGAIVEIREKRVEGQSRGAVPPLGEIMQTAADLLVSPETVSTADVARSVNKDNNTGRAIPPILAAVGLLGDEWSAVLTIGRPTVLRNVNREAVRSFTEALCGFRERVVARILGLDPEDIRNEAQSLGARYAQAENPDAQLYARFTGLGAFTFLAMTSQVENSNAKGLPWRMQAAIDQHMKDLPAQPA